MSACRGVVRPWASNLIARLFDESVCMRVATHAIHAPLAPFTTRRHRALAAMAQPQQQTQASALADSPHTPQAPSQPHQPYPPAPELAPLQQAFSIPPPSPPRTPGGSLSASQGFKKTFYKRKLPSPPAIEFSSPEGRLLFQEALLEGSMVGFFKLMEQFNTQDEPAFCGLASLAMVLNALSIDPRRTWKGSWRWFHEAMLDCCRPLDSVKEEGITLYQASCLARCNGARVELRPYGAPDLSLERFRAEVEAVCASGEEHIVVSYSRKAFLQTGDGHFSPIGGYHRARDLVLVLDVARFKYPPHWVSLPLLYHAMAYVDKVTGKPRGYMRLATNPLLDSVLLTLDVRSEAWRRADGFVRCGAPELVKELAARGGLSGEEVLRAVVDAAPLPSLDAFLVVRSSALPQAVFADPSGSGHSCGDPAPMPAQEAAQDAAQAAAQAAAEVVVGVEPTVCSTPEAMAAAVRRASEMGTAAAEDAAAATAAASASAASAGAPLSVQPALGGAASVPSSKKGCGSSGAGDKVVSKGCGSGTGSSCGTSTGGGTAGGCSSSSLMAAATAILTAHDRCIPIAQRQQLLDELRGMPLYSLVAAHLVQRASAAAAACSATLTQHESKQEPQRKEQREEEEGDEQEQTRRVLLGAEYLAEKVVMALLVQRPEVWPSGEEGWADAKAGAKWAALLGLGGYSVVEAEVAYLREQLAHIDEVLQSGDVTGHCSEHSHRLDCAAHGH